MAERGDRGRHWLRAASLALPSTLVGALVAGLGLASCGGCEGPSESSPDRRGAPPVASTGPRPALSAVGQGADAEASVRPPRARAADAEMGASVSVQDRGEAPRSGLRLRFEEGVTARWRVQVNLVTRVGEGEPMALDVVATVDATARRVAKGEATVTLVLAELTATGFDDASAIAALRSSRGQILVDDRGRVLRKPRLEPAPTGPAAQLWASLAEACADAWVPLPEDPVGRGARWRVRRRLTRGGVLFDRQTDVELVADEPRLRIVGQIREQPRVGRRGDAALPAGVSIEALSGRGVGRRRLAFEPGAPFPVAANAEIASDLELRVHVDASAGTAEPQTRTVQLTQLSTLVAVEALDAAGQAGQ